MVEKVPALKVRRLPVHYAIQTNGMVLDEDWAAFLGTNRFLVGISLDGNQALHDHNRVTPAGSGSFDTVIEKIALLKKYKVEFNILTVVTGMTAGSIRRIYRFFQKNDWPYQQYSPCLDPLGEARGGADYSLTPKKYGRFLTNLFDNWYRDVKAEKSVYNRCFENLVGMLLLQPPRRAAGCRDTAPGRTWWRRTAACTPATSTCWMPTAWGTSAPTALRILSVAGRSWASSKAPGRSNRTAWPAGGSLCAGADAGGTGSSRTGRWGATTFAAPTRNFSPMPPPGWRNWRGWCSGGVL